MSKLLSDLPNAENADYAHDRLLALLARPGEVHAGKIEVRESNLTDLLEGYRALRLELAAQDINTFEGGDEGRAYTKTANVLRAWGSDVPDPTGRVRQCMDEDAAR